MTDQPQGRNALAHLYARRGVAPAEWRDGFRVKRIGTRTNAAFQNEGVECYGWSD